MLGIEIGKSNTGEELKFQVYFKPNVLETMRAPTGSESQPVFSELQ